MEISPQLRYSEDTPRHREGRLVRGSYPHYLVHAGRATSDIFRDIIGVLIPVNTRDEDVHITAVKSERLTKEATVTTILVPSGLANSRGLSSTSQAMGT